MASAHSETSPERSTRSRLPLLLLGVNTWLVAVGWPLLAGEVRELLPWLVAVLPLLCLGVGALLAGIDAPRARDAALWLAFPTAITAATASAYDAAGEAAMSALPLLLAALSACGFGTTLAITTAGTPPTTAVELTPLRASATRALEARAPSWPSSLLFGAGAFALGVVLPALCVPPLLAPRWGEGARQGAVLCAVVGGALGTAVLASYWPSAVRKEQKAVEPSPDAVLRVAWFLFMALLGAVTYYVVQP